ncbi:MAG: hypothetical protein AAF074_24690 [Pseudomonadota bacterium]
MAIDRRQFNGGLIGAAAAAVAGGLVAGPARAAYRGPNVVVVRFGGGVRRRETIEAETSFAPGLLHRLAPRGVLMPQMSIAQIDGVDTSHAEGTINLLTGRYGAYRDVGEGAEIGHFEPTEPTLFEYFRSRFDIPAHQALLVNGEDRPQEEFLSYGIHKSLGVAYRSEVLSLYRFKRWKLSRFLAEGGGTDEARAAAETELAELVAKQSRDGGATQAPEIEAMWAEWQRYYGDDGLKNPRGDAALTELALWALRHLRPRLMMINYQDPDYVHWGNASHYTRAIAAIDRDLARLVAATDADPEYAGNTVFMVVPDCGRDANPLMSVPFQHHFNSRSAHEIFALVFGPGIVRGRVLDKPVDQSAVAATVGAIMGVETPRTESRALEEIFA